MYVYALWLLDRKINVCHGIAQIFIIYKKFTTIVVEGSCTYNTNRATICSTNADKCCEPVKYVHLFIFTYILFNFVTVLNQLIRGKRAKNVLFCLSLQILK